MKARGSVSVLLMGCVLLAAGCKKGPDAADARGALTTLKAIAGADARSALRLRYQSCSELRSCAAGCSDELSFCAKADEDQCGALLGKCFPEAKQATSADAWFRGHFEKFLDEARPQLNGEEQKEFDEARAKAP
jgi:hypothetical protein